MTVAVPRAATPVIAAVIDLWLVSRIELAQVVYCHARRLTSAVGALTFSPLGTAARCKIDVRLCIFAGSGSAAGRAARTLGAHRAASKAPAAGGTATSRTAPSATPAAAATSAAAGRWWSGAAGWSAGHAGRQHGGRFCRQRASHAAAAGAFSTIASSSKRRLSPVDQGTHLES